MSEKIVFKAQPRTLLGRKSKRVRTIGQVPANVSGDLEKSIPVVVELSAFNKLYHKVGDTGLFYLKIEGETKDRPVLVTEVQHDPLSNQILHVVFRQVDLSEKVSAEVPVEVIGEFDVKNALVVTLHNAIEVEALPQDLPEKFVIDLSKFTEVGQSVTFDQLEYDRSKVTLAIEEEKRGEPVVMVTAVKEEIEEVAPVAAEGAAVEGAAPAEGAAAPAADDKKAEEKK